jgi:hypothetical protein
MAATLATTRTCAERIDVSHQDSWDKVEIASKVIAAMILVVIPIIIKSGADTIAQSLQKGQLVKSLTAQPVEGKAKRDIALMALDAAIPPQSKRCDQVSCSTPADRDRLTKDEMLRITIRYANSPDPPAADRLRSVVADLAKIKAQQIKMMNLADADYVVPAGQMEIWAP